MSGVGSTRLTGAGATPLLSLRDVEGTFTTVNPAGTAIETGPQTVRPVPAGSVLGAVGPLAALSAAPQPVHVARTRQIRLFAPHELRITSKLTNIASRQQGPWTQAAGAREQPCRRGNLEPGSAWSPTGRKGL